MNYNYVRSGRGLFQKCTLQPGSIVFVSKLHYGLSVPTTFSELPWIGDLLDYFSGNSNSRKEVWRYRKLFDIGKPKHSDIVALRGFYSPNSQNIMLKRIVGLPGDFIEVIDSTMEVNGRLESSWKIHNPVISNYHENGKMWFFFNGYKCHIPSKGMKVKLNKNTFWKYSKAIEVFENVEIESKNEHYYLEGQRIKYYVFKHDYYYLMGDNRKESTDSRYWGLIPDYLIIGKVVPLHNGCG